MRSRHPRWLTRLAWLTAGLIIAAAPSATAEDTASPPVDEARQQDPPAAAAGLTIFVNPQTGEVIDQPTAEQRAALGQALKVSLSKSSAGLETFELLHGGHGVHLGGRFQSATIARMRPDGSFEILCVDHPDEAAVLLTTPAAATTPEWEEK